MKYVYFNKCDLHDFAMIFLYCGYKFIVPKLIKLHLTTLQKGMSSCVSLNIYFILNMYLGKPYRS